MSANYSSTSLSDWLDRHRGGDPAALNAILHHCQDRLKLLTRQMLRRFPNVHRWEETSDVFQNVLIRLNRALRALTFDSSADFLRLAACHIRRELIDLSRQQRDTFLPSLREGSDSHPDLVGERPNSTNDPYELAVWHEVHTRIDGLPDEDRRLFDLLYYQGMTQPEASELLNIPLRTLKRDWQNVRLKLILLFGNQPPC